MVVQPRSPESSSVVFPSWLNSTPGPPLDDDRPRSRAVDVDRLGRQRRLPGRRAAGSRRHRATWPSAWPATQQVSAQAVDRASLVRRGRAAGAAARLGRGCRPGPSRGALLHPVTEGDHRAADDQGRRRRRPPPGARPAPRRGWPTRSRSTPVASRACRRAIQTAASRPVPSAEDQLPAMAGPSLVSTTSSRPPASQPPKVSKLCGVSARPPVVEPCQVVQRKLEWAPPWALPRA